MRSLPALLRAVPQASADRMLYWAAVLGAAAVLSFVWIGDALNWYDTREIPAGQWQGPPHSAYDLLPVASGAIVAVAAVALLALRLGRRATAAWAALAVAVPGAVSMVLAPLPKGELFGFPFTSAAALGTLLILAVVAYRCAPLPIAGVAAASWLALFSDVVRNPENLPAASDGQLSTTFPAVVMGLVPGLYLRWRAEQRRSHTARARQDERLSVARDLHDEVAHQITGIVVQVQALRHIADSSPDRAQAALPEIEKSAAQALASMRRLVATLRVPEQEAPAINGRGAAAALRSLEQPSAPGRPRIDVVVSGPVDGLPTDVGAALVRIAQEAVTNALRHARDATRVTVSAAAGGGRASLEVRDNGRGDAAAFPGSGGHGLVGMAERARLLGGEATAGPARTGPGWRVRAELPVPDTSEAHETAPEARAAREAPEAHPAEPGAHMAEKAE